MERELLSTLAGSGVPNYRGLEREKWMKHCRILLRLCRQISKSHSRSSVTRNSSYLVNTGAENIIATFVPFQREYGPFMLAQSTRQSTVCLPDPGVTIVRTGG